MRLPQPAAAKGKKVSLIPSSPLHSLFCAKIHVDKTVLGEISIKTQFSKIHVLIWILWCSLKKSQCQCIHTEFDLDPSQSQNANTVVSSKFKSLTGHLYCKTIEQIVHSFTHAYINCFYTI